MKKGLVRSVHNFLMYCKINRCGRSGRAATHWMSRLFLIRPHSVPTSLSNTVREESIIGFLVIVRDGELSRTM